MHTQPRNLIDLLSTYRIIEEKQRSCDASHLILLRAAGIVLFEKATKPAMPEAFDHSPECVA